MDSPYAARSKSASGPVLKVQKEGVMLVLPLASYLVDSGWFAQAGLTVILMGLLIGGILLIAMAVQGLARDLWHFLHPHSH